MLGNPISEFWAFSVRKRQWTSLKFDPPARFGHCMSINPSKTNSLIVFGGWVGPCVNDLWVYNISQSLWSQESSNGPMTPRLFLACSVNSNTGVFYVHGGDDYNSSPSRHFFSDLLDYDLVSRQWILIDAGSSRSSLSEHKMQYSSQSNSLYIFLGQQSQYRKFNLFEKF